MPILLCNKSDIIFQDNKYVVWIEIDTLFLKKKLKLWIEDTILVELKSWMCNKVCVNKHYPYDWIQFQKMCHM